MEEYSTEFFLLLTRIDIRDSEQQLVARFVGGLRQQIQHTLNLFRPLSVSEAHQQALTIEAQTRGNIQHGAHLEQFVLRNHQTQVFSPQETQYRNQNK